MNDSAVITGRDTLTFVRRLPGPIERVWAYLTDSTLLPTWLSQGTVADRVGGEMRFEMGAAGRVTACEPPHLLEYTWNEEGSGTCGPVTDSLVRWELREEAGGVRLTLTHARLPEKELVSHGAGWHAFVDRLAAIAEGRDPEPFDESVERLKATYSSLVSPHRIGTHEEWLAQRLQLLEDEKELTRRSDELARRRQALPWVRIDKDYRFDTDEGPASLADLFRGNSQLLVYHFMFGPDFTAGCPSCSSIADGFNGFAVHLAHHDVTLCAVSRAPIAKLQAYKKRMNWTFPWASSYASDFNLDFQAGCTAEQQRSGSVEYNFRAEDTRRSMTLDEGWTNAIAAGCGTDWPTYVRERPGVSAFALEDGVVYHTYSAYARGLDGLWGMYQWLDRAPRGRNEEEPGLWWKRHDEY